jgi:hypothetical protein
MRVFKLTDVLDQTGPDRKGDTRKKKKTHHDNNIIDNNKEVDLPVTTGQITTRTHKALEAQGGPHTKDNDHKDNHDYQRIYTINNNYRTFPFLPT